MFKKSAIAIALAALAAPSFAAELSAGKDTKFELNVDVGAYYLTKKDAVGSGQNELLGKGLNQVEIKATHNISDDLSVFGEIEYDFDPVVDNSNLVSDDTRLGIASKSFGRLTVGQFDSFFEDNVMEVLGVGHGENAFVSEPNSFTDLVGNKNKYGSGNDGRHLQYSHKIGDLTFAIDLNANNNEDKNDAGHGAAIAAVYKLGDLTVGLGYSDNAKYKSDDSKPNLVKNATGLTASYKLGNTKITGLYATETTTDTTAIKLVAERNVKTNYTGLAVTHTMGAFDIGVALQNRDNSFKTYNEWYVGVGYTPFKNMTVYLDVLGLGLPKDVGDVIEAGVKYTF